MRRLLFSLQAVLLLVVGTSRSAGAAEGDQLYVRVVDVGAGLCCVLDAPGEGAAHHYMVYDAGNYEDSGATAMNAIREILPEEANIDLLVLSHTDSDHIAAVPAICHDFHVKKILHTGMTRTTQVWKNAMAAIKDEVDHDGAEEINLQTSSPDFGTKFTIGKASAYFVAGWKKAPADWGIDAGDSSKQNNAVSIVMRVVYAKRALLFCGDTVGRWDEDEDPETIRAAEKAMVDNAAEGVSHRVRLDSDVIIAGHHGANNACSAPFIRAVGPTFVVFSAGHKFHHPRAITAQRFITNGIPAESIFRTDFGDNEGDTEWDFGASSHADPRGDDDVEITVQKGIGTVPGFLQINYRLVQ